MRYSYTGSGLWVSQVPVGFLITRIPRKGLQHHRQMLNSKLDAAIKTQQIFRQPNLSIRQLSMALGISSKELSKFLNEYHQMNFSEYINCHRIAYVKELLSSSEVEKYTLVSLAELSGFSSKSSFNATFKRMTGMTPSEYKKTYSIIG